MVIMLYTYAGNPRIMIGSICEGESRHYTAIKNMSRLQIA